MSPLNNGIWNAGALRRAGTFQNQTSSFPGALEMAHCHEQPSKPGVAVPEKALGVHFLRVWVPSRGPFLVGLVSVSDWKDWVFFDQDPDHSRISQHDKNMMITKKS